MLLAEWVSRPAAPCEQAADLELVAQIDRDGSIDEAAASGAQVVIDFTRPDVVMGNLERALALGMHAVVGTSGFDDERLAQVEAMVGQTSRPRCCCCPQLRRRRRPSDALRARGGRALRLS